jgi:hypothetical protein
MSQHHPFDDKYWNLSQACAWVVYREKQLVKDFNVTDRTAYMALGMYPSMWPAGRKQYDAVEDLRRALERGHLKASGYRRNTPDRLEEVPAAEWTDLVLRPPLVSFAGQPNNQPWNAVRLLSADVQRLWRSVNEVDGRSKYNWAALREIYEVLQTQNPRMTKNELILELQGTYEDRRNKKAPSRSAIQNKIKTWS